jgi:hypothetical protein
MRSFVRLEVAHHTCRGIGSDLPCHYSSSTPPLCFQTVAQPAPLIEFHLPPEPSPTVVSSLLANKERPPKKSPAPGDRC